MTIHPTFIWAAFAFVTYLYFFIWFWKGLKKENRKSVSYTDGYLEMSVIIAAHNEEQSIAETLESLLHQEYPTDKYEIILAADRCTDHTVSIARKLMDAFQNFRVIEISRVPANYSPKKHAIATALDEARYSHYLFLDADCIVKPFWLKTFNLYFQNQYQAVVSIPKIRSTSPVVYQYLLPERLVTWGLCAAAIGTGKPFLAFGAVWGYTHQAFEQVGGMSQISHVLSGDDDLLIYKMGQQRLPVACCLNPDGWGETRMPESLRAFFTQRRRHHSTGKFYSRNVQLGYLLYHLSNLSLWMLPFIHLDFLLLLGAKFILDFIMLSKLRKIFRESLSILNMISFEVGYLLHHLFIAPLAFLGKVRWK
jgi:cellulose synthase/poly-beta-1,6-N-acetylglucosamine synthase-like glycosyltransferase